MTLLKYHHRSQLQGEQSTNVSTKSSEFADAANTNDQLALDDLAEHFGDIPDDDEDVTAQVNSLSSEAIIQDYLSVSYHIIFSPSYQVPVLYFNASHPDGTSISLNEIYASLVPEEWRSNIQNAGLNGGISQQDHPILNVPFFYMHPCETVSLMDTVIQSHNNDPNVPQSSFLENYIATWLSFTGQAIGVAIPTDMIAGTS
ncbi:E2-like conjugating enzyme atg10 [Lobosporangium transversale]|uniref:Ubiquitin-like-conjugating enzyme ATG10 n=1 Tax=Lobosporangium transversale TaxID=64571 RepID=A0A1Y2GDI0_9FUNG|nr:autophagocytosis associated protein [Lobosporangium transversale]KAF9916828.1 E2-like conjugating enzyme atg10 [Lobosporangium transversale]ORZ06093.1 autophagocytosis associated protein [Lobosporangium transversale]|eukprot:XP_021877362.1 autophagocytosis associated protein [Lobosporangium transversale]